MKVGAGQSFAKIYQTNQKFLNSYLRRRGVIPEDCEDLVQETFLRCFKTILERPEIEHGRLLTTVARNLQIDQYRRKKHQAVAQAPEDLDCCVDDKASSRNLIQRALIEKMVAELSDRRESRFFKLHYEDGLKLQEIAKLSRTPVGTVASQVSRYRSKFQITALPQLEALAAFLD